MSNIVIRSINPLEASSRSIFREMDKVMEQIRERAFQLFEQRSSRPDQSLSDWFNAEREMLNLPPAELSETESEFRIKAAVPGIDAKQIKVDALPDAIVIEGETKQSKEEKKGDVLFSEFTGQKMFRRFALPAKINPDNVTAKVEHGMLEIVAKKAETALAKRVAVA